MWPPVLQEYVQVWNKVSQAGGHHGDLARMSQRAEAKMPPEKSRRESTAMTYGACHPGSHQEAAPHRQGAEDTGVSSGGRVGLELGPKF